LKIWFKIHDQGMNPEEMIANNLANVCDKSVLEQAAGSRQRRAKSRVYKVGMIKKIHFSLQM